MGIVVDKARVGHGVVHSHSHRLRDVKFCVLFCDSAIRLRPINDFGFVDRLLANFNLRPRLRGTNSAVNPYVVEGHYCVGLARHSCVFFYHYCVGYFRIRFVGNVVLCQGDQYFFCHRPVRVRVAIIKEFRAVCRQATFRDRRTLVNHGVYVEFRSVGVRKRICFRRVSFAPLAFSKGVAIYVQLTLCYLAISRRLYRYANFLLVVVGIAQG